jgi:serine/threonine protein kinase
MEKEGVNKKYLMQEFFALSYIQNANVENQNFPKIYQFYENTNRNFFSMDLLGDNILTHMKKNPSSNNFFILGGMLDAIEQIHNKGLVHLDLKPANFVLDTNILDPKVYLIDFGLSQPCVTVFGEPIKIQNKDFTGTFKYASLNCHLVECLGKRDDLWSFFFIILEFLNIELPWAYHNKNFTKNDLKVP